MFTKGASNDSLKEPMKEFCEDERTNYENEVVYTN